MVFMSSNAMKIHLFISLNIQCNDRKGTNNSMNFIPVELYAVSIFLGGIHPPDEVVPIIQSKELLPSQHSGVYFLFQLISYYLNSNELWGATQWCLQGTLTVQLCYFTQRRVVFFSLTAISLDGHVKGKSNIEED